MAVQGLGEAWGLATAACRANCLPQEPPVGWIRCLLSQSGLRQRLLVSCVVLGDVSDKPFPKKGKACLQTKVRPVCLYYLLV